MFHKAHFSPTIVACFASAAMILVGFAGCPGGGGNIGGEVIGERDENHLQDAVNLLPRLGEVHPERGAGQMQYHLDRWLANDAADSDWKSDTLFELLPPQYDIVKEKAPLDAKVFSREDVLYLRQCYWSQSTANWVLKTKADPTLTRWTTTNEPPTEDTAFLSDISSSPLTEAVRLFDWSIRNVRLETLRELKDIGVGPQTTGSKNVELPAATGAPGPGYMLLPWQSMLYGRGDFWQRSRVFIQLARQRKIEAVVLAIDEGSATGRANPWAVGVLIDDDIFLFDSRIGLPIPGPGGVGVATLKQVLADPTILKQCDVTSGGETIPYPVTKKELGRLVALVDASPEAMSKRMQMLETALTGSSRLVLSVSPSKVAERLNKLNLPRVRLWRVPLEATLYRNWFMQSVNAYALAENKNSAPRYAVMNHTQYMTTEMTFRGPGPFAKARDLHLRGLLENQVEYDGAKTFYLASRIPDSVLNELAESVELQQQFGIYDFLQTEKDAARREQRVKSYVSGMRQSKEFCNQFLALAQFDQGKFSTAKNWSERAIASSNDRQAELQTLIDESPNLTDAQRAGIEQELADRRELLGWSQYMQARALEAENEIVDAKVLLREIKSPQREGNFVRAQWAGREPGQPLSKTAVEADP